MKQTHMSLKSPRGKSGDDDIPYCQTEDRQDREMRFLFCLVILSGKITRGPMHSCAMPHMYVNGDPIPPHVQSWERLQARIACGLFVSSTLDSWTETSTLREMLLARMNGTFYVDVELRT